MLTTRVLFEISYTEQDKLLLNAARKEDQSPETIAQMESALKKGANINIKDMRIESYVSSIGAHYTPLMWAAHRGHLNKVQLLIKHKADPSITTGHHNTPLHVAAREGHLPIVIYLAKEFPDLLKSTGEDKLTPEEIAEKYGAKREITKLFKENYANPLYPALKAILPFEIAMSILIELKDDPVTLSRLFSLNKAWHAFCSGETFLSLQERSVRMHLPPKLQLSSWQEIYQHYYKGLVVKDNAFHAFMNKLCIFYIISNSISMLEKKPDGEHAVESLISIPFMLSHWIDRFPSDMRYRQIPDQEVEQNIATHCGQHTELTAYSNLCDVASEEQSQARKAENLYRNQVKTRKPIYEVTMKPKEAINYLTNTLPKVSLFAEDLSMINNWRMGAGQYENANDKERIVHSMQLKITTKAP